MQKNQSCQAVTDVAGTTHSRSRRHVAIRVDRANVNKAKSHLTDRRIEFEFQDHGIAHSICLHDPDGHKIEITTHET